jgi:ElaA protein
MERIQWSWRAWGELTRDELYDALALRSRVFVLEQGPYLDPDGVDRHSRHLFGRDAAGMLQAYLRLVQPGIKYPHDASIGRVITSAERRGTGLGRALVAEGLAGHQRWWPGVGNRISAQSRLEAFYSGFGWQRVGGDYLEDNIPHCEMLWREPGSRSHPHD